MNARTSRPALAALLFVLAACGKKEEGASRPPSLAAPERAFQSAGRPAAAEIEVKASSGPVELTLLIYKTRVKAGDLPWYQLRLRNISNKDILVSDRAFQDPRELNRHSPSLAGDGGYGIYLDIFGPDGKRLWKRVFDEGDIIAKEVSGLQEVEGPAEQAMVDGWKKKGLSPHEVNMKLFDYNLKKRRAKEKYVPPPSVKLKPGETVETKSWFYYGWYEKRKKKPVPQPIGDFSRLEFFEFDAPGKYKIRAVYDYAPTKFSRSLERKIGLPTYPDEVLARTPWLQVTVTP